MSIKHVNRYYKQLCDQYKEMIDNIKDIEKEAEQGLVEPERVERLKSQVEPIKTNYERCTYLMFLLHQPNRKEKVRKYLRQNNSVIEGLNKKNSLEGVLEENEDALKHIGE